MTLTRFTICCAVRRFAFILTLCAFSSILGTVAAQDPEIPKFNFTINGTTVRKPRDLFTDFAEVGVGKGGQAVYPFTVSEREEAYITISTCPAASFDTYIVVFSSPHLVLANVIAESNNDLSCKASKHRSTISAILRNGTYYVLVTGANLAEGSFTLQFTMTTPNVSLSWGLDRIDQRTLPLDGKYSVDAENSDGQGISVYVLDSGVRSTHEEFGTRVRDGFDFVELDKTAQDCTGLGTHATAIIAGKTYGVAKRAQVVSVRVLDCSNTALVSNIVDAIEWVLLDIQYQPSSQIPAVIYLRFHSSTSAVINNAVTSAVKFGIPVIAPAGDYGNDMFCNSTTPASANSALIVGATDANDYRSSFSNTGECVNLYAPGANITSASHTSDTARSIQGGTAQAAAYVTGIAAILMSINSGVKPRDLKSILTSLGSVNIVRNATSQIADYTPRFAYVRSIPKFSKHVPPEKKVYIYFVLKLLDGAPISNDSCLDEGFNRNLRKAIDVDDNEFFAECFESTLTAQVAVLFRVLQSEKELSAKSSHIQQVLMMNSRPTARDIGSRYVVIEEPWFVDSNGFIFWSEPQFAKQKKTLWTAGAISGIVCGVIVTMIVGAVIICGVYRKATGKDDIESMQGSADFDKGPVLFNDHPVDQARDSPMFSVKRSFRNVMSMNFIKSGSSKQEQVSEDTTLYGHKESSPHESRQIETNDADVLRMQSYGAEAFARLILGDAGDRPGANEMASDAWGNGSPNDIRAASLRTSIAMGFAPRGRPEQPIMDGTEGSFRMHSHGGEAFASIFQGLGSSMSRDDRESQSKQRDGAQQHSP